MFWQIGLEPDANMWFINTMLNEHYVFLIMYLANWAYIQCQYVIHKINVFKQFFLVFYYYSQSGNDPQENSQIWLQDKYENKILKHF